MPFILSKEGQSIDQDQKIIDWESKIVRASSWRDLFPSKEEEEADFLSGVIKDVKDRYKGNNTLKQYRVESHPEGDIHIFESTEDGYSSTYQKLISNGNVVIINNQPNFPTDARIIVPDVGNIAHNFSAVNTILPREFLEQLGDDKLKSIIGMGFAKLAVYMEGKWATRYWEEMMLKNKYLPQRIGYQIYTNFVLEAQSKLLEAYPQAFS